MINTSDTKHKTKVAKSITDAYEKILDKDRERRKAEQKRIDEKHNKKG